MGLGGYLCSLDVRPKLLHNLDLSVRVCGGIRLIALDYSESMLRQTHARAVAEAGDGSYSGYARPLELVRGVDSLDGLHKQPYR